MSANVFEWIDPPSGALGDFIWEKKYYFFEGWQWTGSSWVRLYAWGPVKLNRNELSDQQSVLYSNVKPGGSYDWAGIFVWKQAVGQGGSGGWHWELFGQKAAPGVQGEVQARGAPSSGPTAPPPSEEQASPAAAAITDLFGSLRNNLVSGWDSTKRVYEQSTQTLAAIGKGFSPDENQRVFDVRQLSKVATSFLDDALSGKRQVGYDAGGQLVIGALPGDEFRLEDRGGQPVVVSASTNQVVHGTGVGEPVTIVAIIAVTAVALATVYLCVSAHDAIKVWMHEQTVAKAMELGCNKPGQPPCTPEQIAAMQGAIRQSQADLERATKSNLGEDITQQVGGVLKTVLWVAAAAAALYVGAQVIPPLLRTRTAAAAA